MKITAMMIVHGSPPHFKESLKSLIGQVDEIIIGDVAMTTEIPSQISKKIKTRIIKLDPKTAIVELVKEDLKKEVSGDYILYLDPDEVISLALWGELKKNMNSYDYFLIPRKNRIFGKWIRHSRWWPDYQIRFFKKDKVVWPQTLHSQPVTYGKEYKVEPEERYSIVHFNYDSISDYLAKAERYAKSEAQELIKKGKTLTLAETIKKSLAEFISRFLAYDGYKDGVHGFVLAILQMFYYFLVYFYYWEGKKYFSISQETLVKDSHSYFQRGLIEVNFWLIKKSLVTGIYKIKLKIQSLILKITS